MQTAVSENSTHEKTKLLLEDRQLKLEIRLSAVRKDLQKSHSKDWEEQAQERENDEVLEALENEISHELIQIKEALNRIEKGSYGICSECGTKIDANRLNVMPDALHCINCAE